MYNTVTLLLAHRSRHVPNDDTPEIQWERSLSSLQLRARKSSSASPFAHPHAQAKIAESMTSHRAEAW